MLRLDLFLDVWTSIYSKLGYDLGISLHAALQPFMQGVAAQVDKTRSIREGMARQTDEIKKQAKIVKNDLDFLDALNERTLQQPVHTPHPSFESASHIRPNCSVSYGGCCHGVHAYASDRFVAIEAKSGKL